jgi:hypothetical protein
VREKFDGLRDSTITLAAGAVICLIGLISLCAAVVIGLTHYMFPFMAALLTGAALGLVGAVIVFIGLINVRRQL